MGIEIKTKEEIAIMMEGGRILSQIMKRLKNEAKPGVKTKTLDEIAHDLILKAGGKCSFLGYEGFPACICTSINEEIVHCIPSERKLKEGDLLKIDVGLFWRGFHLDMAETFGIGKISSLAKKLIETTKKALELGIKKLKPKNRIGDVSFVIQSFVEKKGFNVIRELVGHGIGREIHQDPKIPNFGKKGEGIEIKEGMVVCLEPMVAVGNWKLEKTKDGFGFKTVDNSLTAHFEATVAVLKRGPKILTKII